MKDLILVFLITVNSIVFILGFSIVCDETRANPSTKGKKWENDSFYESCDYDDDNGS